MEITSTLLYEIKEAQKDDKGMARTREKMMEGKAVCFFEDDQDVLWFGKRLVVPKVETLRKKILVEAYDSLYSSGEYQDVPRRQAEILVDSHEARNRSVCC